MTWKVLSEGIVCTHVKYESGISSGLFFLFIIKVKFFKSRSNFKAKVWHQVNNYGTKWKVLLQWSHVWNMKALSLPVWKIWQRFKFFNRIPNFKVKETRGPGALYRAQEYNQQSCTIFLYIKITHCRLNTSPNWKIWKKISWNV